jgi:hypothetical protein
VAQVFHYGWVKDPKTMLVKKQEQTKVYHGDAPPPSEAKLYELATFGFEDYPILKEFRGSHPAVMRARVAAAQRLGPRRNRWLEPAFYRAVLRRGFRG